MEYKHVSMHKCLQAILMASVCHWINAQNLNKQQIKIGKYKFNNDIY